MATNLLATQCPDLVTPASVLYKADAYSSNGLNLPVARRVYANPITNPINTNALQMDLQGRYGGGGYAIATGLVLTAPVTGLTLTVTAGHALIDGVVELAATATVALTGSHTGTPVADRHWVWLLQDGTLTFTTNTLTPPDGNCCLLGNVTTSASDITAVDFSGVMYLRGGHLYRATGDLGVPQDTPPSSLLFYQESGTAIYLWSGSRYFRVGEFESLAFTVENKGQDQLDDLERRFQTLVGNLAQVGLDEIVTPDLEADLEAALAA